MANKPQYFDIEDSQTGKVYRVETDDPAATYDEAAGYLEALPEDQWSSFEYKPQQASPVTTPEEPAAVSAPKVAAPSTGRDLNERPLTAFEANIGDGTTYKQTLASTPDPGANLIYETLWAKGERNPDVFNRAMQEYYKDPTFAKITPQAIAQLQERDAWYAAAKLQNPGNFIANKPTGIKDPEAPTNVLEQAGQAASRSVSNVYNSGVGFAALGADLVGADETSDDLLEQYINNNAKISFNYGTPLETGDIEDLSSASMYVADVIGELGPQLIGSMGLGALGKELATHSIRKGAQELIESKIESGIAREIAEKQVADQLKRRATQGVIGGTLASTVPQEAGSNFGQTYMETGGEKAPLMSIAAGIASGSLDAFLPIRSLKNIGGDALVDEIKRSFIERAAKEGAKSFAIEGATESLQAFISTLPTAVITGESPFTTETLNKMKEAFFRGGVGGGIAGITTGAVQGNNSLANADAATEPSSIVMPTGHRNKKVYKDELASVAQQGQTHVDSVSEGWNNAPVIKVHPNFTKLKGVNNRALGVYMPDGSVAINIERVGEVAAKRGVSVEDMTNSVLFHETLGHFALNTKYGQDLDSTLDGFYQNGSGAFKNLVDEWMADNPNQYAEGDPRNQLSKEDYRRTRAIEEVMVKWAEDEGVVPQKLIDTVMNLIKDYARKLNINGYQPSYSPRELKAMLGAIQRETVIKSKTSDKGAGNSDPRYMYIGEQAATQQAINSEDDSGELADDLALTKTQYIEELHRAATPEARNVVRRKYAADGESRQNTGWFLAPDQKWRFEISDENANLIGIPDEDSTNMTLDDILEHPELFELYPELASVNVKTKTGSLGSYNEDTKVLTLSPDYARKLDQADSVADPKEIEKVALEALSTLLHEVQHAIQGIEDFARGGNPSSALQELPTKTLEKGSKNYEKYLEQVEIKPLELQLKAADNVRESDQYQAYKKAYDNDVKLFELYKRKKEVLGINSKEAWAGHNKWRDHRDALRATKIDFHQLLGLPEYVTQSEGVSEKEITDYYLLTRLLREPKYETDRLGKFKKRFEEVKELNADPTRDSLLSYYQDDSKATLDAYEHLFGEYEARDVQARMDMSTEQRRNSTPYTSEKGIDPESLAVTRYDGRNLETSESRRMPTEDEVTSAGFRKTKVDERSRLEARKQLWASKTNPDWDSRYPNGVPPEGDNRYMMDPDDDQGVPLSSDDIFEMRNAADINSQLSEGYIPEVRTWADVKRDARLTKGLTPGSIKNIKGVGDISLKLHQYEVLQQRLNDKVTVIYAKMQSGGTTLKLKEDFLATIFRYKELKGRIFQDQAEVGRALSFMRALTLTRSKLENINDLLDSYKDGNKTVGAFVSDDVFNEFAQKVNYMITTGNQGGAANLIRSIETPYWWQYVLTVRHASMLSGMGTHAKNAYDGLMVMMTELEETILAVPIFYVRKGLQSAGMDVKDGVSPQEAVARIYGLLRAGLDSNTYLETYKAFKEGHQSRPYSAKIEMQDARIKYLSSVNDALFASDIFFRAFHSNANLYSLGVRKAYADGFRGMRALEEGTSIAMNPTPEMIAQARQLTDTALLVDSPSALSSGIEAIKAIKPGMDAGAQAKSFFANMIFAFLRVNDRLLFQQLRRSPLSILDKNTRNEWVMGGAARDIAIARTLYGTALIIGYWNQAGTGDDEEGDIEGEGPANYKKQQSLEATGYRTNSRVEDGNMVDIAALNLSIRPFDTNNATAARVASVRETWERSGKSKKDTETVSSGLAEATRTLLNVLASASYAENISLILDPLTEKDPARRETTDAAFAGGFVSQFVPAAVRQLAQGVTDPNKKITKGDGSFSDRTLGRVISGIPYVASSGIPGVREGLPDRIDFLGDPMPQGRTAVGIGNYTPIKQDAVAQELRKIDRQISKPLLSGAPSSFQITGEDANGEKVTKTVRLTVEQQQKWTSIQGKLIRLTMEQVIELPTWDKAPLSLKVEVVKELKTEAYEKAKEAIILEVDPIQLEDKEL